MNAEQASKMSLASLVGMGDVSPRIGCLVPPS